MVIQIRGTSGSGKTWIVNQLRKAYRFTQIVTKDGTIFGYKCLELRLVLIGKYETACGGCDAIPTQDEICKRIKIAVKNGYNVIFEGLICSHIAKRYAELYKHFKKLNVSMYMIFLDTPLDKCRENINKRRIAAGKEPTFAKNTEKDYVSTAHSRDNMHSFGVPELNMPILSSKKAYKKILTLLQEENDAVYS